MEQKIQLFRHFYNIWFDKKYTNILFQKTLGYNIFVNILSYSWSIKKQHKTTTLIYTVTILKQSRVILKGIGTNKENVLRCTFFWKTEEAWLSFVTRTVVLYHLTQNLSLILIFLYDTITTRSEHVWMVKEEKHGRH